MALIYTYPELQVPIPDDLLLISDSSTQYKQTRSIKFSNLSTAIIGFGTPDFLTKWDSSGTKLEDSVIFEEPGTVYNTTKNVVVGGNIYQSDMSNSISIGKGALQNAVVQQGFPAENVAIGETALNALIYGTNNEDA